jgi:hypothetical protein
MVMNHSLLEFCIRYNQDPYEVEKNILLYGEHTMSKCTLEYNLPEDKEDLDCALNGAKYKHALWEVGQQVFRPARKHGYADRRIQELVERLDELVDAHVLSDTQWPRDEYGPLNATDLISLLEKLFYQTIDSQGVVVD